MAAVFAGGAVLILVGPATSTGKEAPSTCPQVPPFPVPADMPPQKVAALAKLQPCGPPLTSKDLGDKVPVIVDEPLQVPMHNGEVGTQTSLGGVPVPFNAETFILINMWLQLRGHSYYSIYAGSLPHDPRQGAMMISVVSGDTGDREGGSGLFQTPEKLGPLTLISVSGNRVRFGYEGGSGTFDLSTEEYRLHPSLSGTS